MHLKATTELKCSNQPHLSVFMCVRLCGRASRYFSPYCCKSVSQPYQLHIRNHADDDLCGACGSCERTSGPAPPDTNSITFVNPILIHFRRQNLPGRQIPVPTPALPTNCGSPNQKHSERGEEACLPLCEDKTKKLPSC